MKTKTNLLDSIIIILSSATLTLFLLWAGGEVLQLGIFENPPKYLQKVANNIFLFVTGGVGLSLLALLIRKQINKDQERPNYIIYILGVTVLFVIIILLLAEALSRANTRNNERNVASTGSLPVIAYSRADLVKTKINENGVTTITGRFANRDFQTVEIVPSYEYFSNEKEPYGIFHKILKNGKYLGRVGGANYPYEFIEAVCLNSNTNNLNIIMSSWQGGAVIPAVTLWLTIKEDTVEELTFYTPEGSIESLGLLDCDKDAIAFEADTTFQPCKCVLADVLNQEDYINQIIDKFDPIEEFAFRINLSDYRGIPERGKVYSLETSSYIDKEGIIEELFNDYSETVELNEDMTFRKIQSSIYEAYIITAGNATYYQKGYLFIRERSNPEKWIWALATCSEWVIYEIQGMEAVSFTSDNRLLATLGTCNRYDYYDFGLMINLDNMTAMISSYSSNDSDDIHEVDTTSINF